MALVNKRILDLPERAELSSDDYTVVDGSNGGTAKYKLSKMQENIDGVGQTVSELSQTVAAHGTRLTTAEQNIAKNTENIDDLKEDLNARDLSSVAYGNTTFADIFFGPPNFLKDLMLDSGTFAPCTVNAGTPEIVESNNDVALTHKVLKCFGSSSVQIKHGASQENKFINGNYYFMACGIKVDRYAAGRCGVICSGTNPPESLVKTDTTNGWEIISHLVPYTGTNSTGAKDYYVGTANSADADCYIAMPVIIDVAAINIPVSTEEERTVAHNTLLKIYKNFLRVFDGDIYKERRETMKREMFCATVMSASSDAKRFENAKSLFDISRKKYITKYYNPTALDTSSVNKGLALLLPHYNGAFYEKYDFPAYYSADENTQAIPASTTKVLTIITALNYTDDIHDTYTLEQTDISTGSGSAFQTGDVLSIEDMFYAMLLESSNTCAQALGTYIGRKILKDASATYSDAQTACVTAMNNIAVRIGCLNSDFTAPSGGSSDARSTCYDLMHILVEASSFPEIIRIWNKKTHTIHVGGTNQRDITVSTTVTDTTLEESYYIFGGKTGSWSSGGNVGRALVIIATPK